PALEFGYDPTNRPTNRPHPPVFTKSDQSLSTKSRMIKGLALSLLGSSLATVAAATTLQVHHRIVHLSSDLEIPQFEHRGAIVDVLPQSPNQQASPSQSTSFRSDSGSVAKIEEWVDTWKDDPAYRSGEILYQVALQRKKDDTIDLWDVQSVRL
ncbi:hypothetical protein FRB90_004700, partial [Tulasnella sp. 427]